MQRSIAVLAVIILVLALPVLSQAQTTPKIELGAQITGTQFSEAFTYESPNGAKEVNGQFFNYRPQGLYFAEIWFGEQMSMRFSYGRAKMGSPDDQYSVADGRTQFFAPTVFNGGESRQTTEFHFLQNFHLAPWVSLHGGVSVFNHDYSNAAFSLSEGWRNESAIRSSYVGPVGGITLHYLDIEEKAKFSTGLQFGAMLVKGEYGFNFQKLNQPLVADWKTESTTAHQLNWSATVTYRVWKGVKIEGGVLYHLLHTPEPWFRNPLSIPFSHKISRLRWMLNPSISF